MSRDVAIVIGTAVGGYFGEPGLGYAIGSLVGNAYDPVKMERQGPRLNDLKVQVSDYGKMVPKLYGASRFAGNVIWSTDVIETQHTETSGGKGGGPQVNSSTYTYSQSFAIALGEGEVAGIGKIWANGKLIYNMHADADAATITSSKAMLQFMRLHTGSETQTADSLIEAHVGVGNTPAYRGTAYVVFEDMQLGAYGNRMPNLEFELMAGAADSATVTEVSGGNIATTAQGIVTFGGHYLAALLPATAPNGVVKIYDIAIPSAPQLVYSLAIPNGYPTAVAAGSCIVSNGSGLLYMISGSGYFVVIDVSNPSLPSIRSSLSGFGSNTVVSVIANGSYAYLLGWLNNTLQVVSVADTLAPVKIAQFATRTSPQRGFISGDYLYIAHYGDGYLQIWNVANNATPALTGEVDTGLSVTDVTVLGNYAFLNTSGLHVYDVSNKAAPTLAIVLGIGPTLALKSTSIGYIAAATTLGVRLIDVSVPTDPVAVATLASETSVEIIDEANGYLYALNIGATIKTLFYADKLVTIAPDTLGNVVSSICARAGLTAAQIDVTQLTDSVTGYVVQRSTARAQIEQLMQAFYFDAVESDGKIKFVKRGGATALTIAEDDLAAHIYGSQFPENLIVERRQELELPVEVNVQYMDVDTAYQVSSQRSQRLITSSSNKLALNLAISMDGSKAKQVSDVLMFDSWTARTSFGLQNGWKYGYLEPTDVIGVSKGALTYNVRLIDEDAAAGVFSRNAVLDDASVYSQSAVAAPPLSPTANVSAVAVIDLLLLDIPLLRDQDDGIGFYAAACKYSGAWSGEQTFKSNDGGTSWSQAGRAMLNEATVGVASTALGDFQSGNIFDETNSVDIIMVNGALSGATELAVLNGANVLLLGSEIIQFKNASLIATGIYRLSGLLRGRQGTEWAISTHTAGDRAVLLSASTTYLFESGSSEYNLARQYRGVAIGGFLDDAVSVSFTNTGVAQECYAPVHVKGGRTAANDVVLYWTRRTRVGGAWNDYSDVPLGEASEAYVVEIYSSATYATLKRTISGITSETTTYTAAQQTADGLTPGNPVYFIVYQVSATVGSGYGTRGIAP